MASDTTIRLKQAEHQYPIRIAAGVLAQAGAFIQEVLPNVSRVFIVTDTAVASHYLSPLMQSLVKAGYTVESISIMPGESAKTIETLEKLYDAALAFNLKRNDAVIALGGGIVGDTAGFFAATYMRGVPFIQIPTTLLAQVDASVGGKVAVNWKHLKNMMGAFYHPHGVLIDIDLLRTLPPRDFACGMAEVIKYSLLEKSVPGFTAQPDLFSLLQAHAMSPWENLDAIILRCCQIKAAVVEADPEERHGLREILNLGHTFGHAYETLSQGAILHGEAVAIGLVQAFLLAAEMGAIPEEDVIQVKALLEAYNLPLESPQTYPAQQLLQCMVQDKKALHSDSFRLVLPYQALGYVRVENTVPKALLEKRLTSHYSAT